MLLATQIQVILFHLLCGWLYAFGFSFLQTLTQYHRRSLLTSVCEVVYHALVSILLFAGLLQLNGAVTNFYLFLFFLLGAYLYYCFYFMIFYHFFTVIRHFIHKRITKISIAKSHMIGIIKKNTNRLRRLTWRDAHDSKKTNVNDAS